MKIFYGYRNVHGLKDPVAAIGVFDGLHIGHRRVIGRMLRCAAGRGHDKVIITFDPHPRNFLFPRRKRQRIMSLDHKLALFGKMGVDAAVVVNFSDHIARMSAEDFVDEVLLGMGIRTIYVGENFRFGRGRGGDVLELKKFALSSGIRVSVVRSVKRKGIVVSSSAVRSYVLRGKLDKAERLLRRPVSILGTVVKGDERGRKFGIPTANIDPHQEVIPPPGVYAVKADIEGELRDGVLNIGFKPTFYGRNPRRKEPEIEAHIFDFDRHIYGLAMEIFFIEKLRNERKFSSESALVDEIMRDKEKARKILNNPRIGRRIERYRVHR